jgi:predicted dehydrogenase
MMLRTKNARQSKPIATPGSRLRVAVMGCGYWGPNLIRNFNACRRTCVAALCETDAGRLRRVKELAPRARLYRRPESVFSDPEIEAVVIATPATTHADLVSRALEAGKHVLVEKPLATCVRDAEQLVDTAEARNRILMVDHTFLFSPAIRKIKELIDEGQLGEIFYFDSVRINLGLFQRDVNVLWDLAPHDLAIVDLLLGRPPKSVTAIASCHASAGREDVCHLHLDFGNSVTAAFHVNWLSPVKVRHLIIGAGKKSVVYNDLNHSEQVKVYDRGISVAEDPEAKRGILINYRTGDAWSPHLEQEEPLQNVVRHFAECIASGNAPISDGKAGLRIVRILEAAQESIQNQGARVLLRKRPALAAA